MIELLRRVEVEGTMLDVRLVDGIVADVAAEGLRPGPDDAVVEGRGGALLPGLHDHHVHLLALAAERASVDCGAGLAALRTAPGRGWVRGSNYHESTDGEVDRHVLDLAVPHRPVRVQHRSGALWILNTEALRRVSTVLDDSADVERDDRGEPTGRLWRYDTRLRPALPAYRLDLPGLSQELASLGITGVTDATPDLDAGALALLGTLPQRVTVLGAPTSAALPPGMTMGPVKLLLRDHDLPAYDDLVATIAGSHREGRGVAVHCVTRESLVLTLAALAEAGPHPADRIEHAAVVPPSTAAWMGELGVAVATQPDFLRSRGAAYLQDMDPDDRPHLYPHARLLAAGVPTVASSDGPYGSVDPWRVIATASDRPIGPEESVTAGQALEGYLTHPLAPGRRVRRVAVGARADLVLLHLPLAEALRAPEASLVRATWIDGERRWDAEGHTPGAG